MHTIDFYVNKCYNDLDIYRPFKNYQFNSKINGLDVINHFLQKKLTHIRKYIKLQRREEVYTKLLFSRVR